MTRALHPGNRVSLRDLDADLDLILLGLRWAFEPATEALAALDLDAGLLLLDAEGRLDSSDDLVFLPQQKAADGAAVHLGPGELGDNELYRLSLARMPARVARIELCLALAEDPGQDMTRALPALELRLFGIAAKAELLRLALPAGSTSGPGLRLAALLRDGDGWVLSADVQPLAGGIVAEAQRRGAVFR